MAVTEVLDYMDVKIYEGTFLVLLCCLPFLVPCSLWICALILLVLYVCLVCIKKHKREMLKTHGKAVLVTGCDTGFGHHLAKRLHNHGADVFAGVLSSESEGAVSLRSLKSKHLHVTKLDVTKQDEVDATVKAIQLKVGNKGLWGVVNNAGFNIYGDVELVTIEQYKKCMDVNLYGMIRVTKACLPLIRKARGRVVNISSVMGRFVMPSDSVYVISKHGVETLTDSLRLEMRKFGVGVAVVAPGRFDAATSCTGPSSMARIKNELETSWSSASEEVKSAYGREQIDVLYNKLESESLPRSTSSPDPVLDAIEDALFNAKPRPRYVVSGSNRMVDNLALLARVYSFLPECVSDEIVARLTGCDKKYGGK